jgi:hypothetical protein
MRLVLATDQPHRHAEPDRQLHRDIALRRLRTCLLERGLDQRQGGGTVATVELDLGQELARQLSFAAHRRHSRVPARP